MAHEPGRRIAFMHIPKTAGTSVVKAFERELGADQCLQKTASVMDQDFLHCRFVSGHHALCAITPTAWRFTFLREPVAQLASHLRWLDYYNEPSMRRQALALPPAMRHIVVRIGQTDFGSAAHLQAFFQWLPHDAPAVFGNVQSRVLAHRHGTRPITDPTDLATAAIHSLQMLNFVGQTEQLDQDMRELFAQLGLGGPPELGRENTISSPRTFDLRDHAIRTVLEHQMQADLLLYRHVTQQRTMTVRSP